MANVAVKRVGPHHPGGRRAGCPHPAGPLAGANTPGGYGIRPYDRWRAPRPTGKLRPCHTTNPCRGRYLHRPAHPGAATRFRGRDKSRPYEQILCFGPNRNGRSPPGRRRAGCPHPAGPPAGAKTPGGYGIRPYDRRRAPRPTGKLRPCHTTNPCRGRCLHRPGGHASPQGPAGGINPAPTNKFCVSGQTGTAAPHPGGRRAGCPHPAGPPAAANTPGGYGIRPYDRRRAPRPTGKLRPCHTTNPCRGRCLHRPGDHAPPQGSAGGINPAPTNKFCVSGQTGTAAPPGGRRAGCPHPAGPPAAANTPGGYGIRPYEQILYFGPNRYARGQFLIPNS